MKRFVAILCAGALSLQVFAGTALASQPDLPVSVPAAGVVAVQESAGGAAAAQETVDGDAGADPAVQETAQAPAYQGPEISAPCGILMEASTGTVLYEKNADEARNPASVTKIMTLLLISTRWNPGKSGSPTRWSPAPTPNPWAAPRCFWRRARCRPWRR